MSARRLRLLNISKNGQAECLKADGFADALREIGELTIINGGKDLSPCEVAAHARAHDVFLTGWGAVPLPSSLAVDPGLLRYICGITGSMKEYVPIDLLRAGIPLTNWGDFPANSIAEGALALLLACLKDLRLQQRTIEEGGWHLSADIAGGSLFGLNVGIYGCGVIGRKFVELLRPFDCSIHVYDRYAAELPAGTFRVDSLAELFELSQAVVIHASLTPETEKSVNADMLRRLPDHGVLVNTARGGIVDQPALFAEVKSGRLRAGLDVLAGSDWLEPGDPARNYPNLILTAHDIGRSWPGQQRRMNRMHRYALDNLRRFASGESLRWVMDESRYLRST